MQLNLKLYPSHADNLSMAKTLVRHITVYVTLKDGSNVDEVFTNCIRNKFLLKFLDKKQFKDILFRVPYYIYEDVKRGILKHIPGCEVRTMDQYYNEVVYPSHRAFWAKINEG